jgi:hypothetical protein
MIRVVGVVAVLMVCSGSGEITGIIETCQTPSTLEFAVGTFDMDFTLRHEDVDGDDGGSSLWSFPALFSALSLQQHARTHARVRRFDNERAFSVSPNLQCMCSQLQNHCAHAPFVGAFTDITCCHCAYSWLPAYLGLPLCPPSLTGIGRPSS